MEDQIESMLVNIIDNMDALKEFESHKDFKREWLFKVSDVAMRLGQELNRKG
jgi:hypothetical protein